MKVIEGEGNEEIYLVTKWEETKMEGDVFYFYLSKRTLHIKLPSAPLPSPSLPSPSPEVPSLSFLKCYPNILSMFNV